MPGIVLGTEEYEIKKGSPGAYSLDMGNLVRKTDY